MFQFEPPSTSIGMKIEIKGEAAASQRRTKRHNASCRHVGFATLEIMREPLICVITLTCYFHQHLLPHEFQTHG